MPIYRCLVCKQPITREMLIETQAGNHTGGYCRRCFERRSVDVMDEVNKQDEPIIEASSEVDPEITNEASETEEVTEIVGEPTTEAPAVEAAEETTEETIGDEGLAEGLADA